MIRPRRESDLPALVRVLRDVYEADGYPSVWPPDPLAFVQTSAPLGAWVAEAGGQPAGQVLLYAVVHEDGWDAVLEPSLSPLALIEVKRLFVAPSARGLGLAQQLLAAALDEAARRNLRAVLQTRADNDAAIRFYERGGWQQIGSAQAPWTDENGEHPQMSLFLAPHRPYPTSP